MGTSDLIASGALIVASLALIVAVVSAYYTRRQSKAAKKANTTAQYKILHPLRLDIYEKTIEFLKFSETFLTKYGHLIIDNPSSMETINGYSVHLDKFKSNILLYEKLHMPNVEDRIKKIIAILEQFERFLPELRRSDDEINNRKWEFVERFGIEGKKPKRHF